MSEFILMFWVTINIIVRELQARGVKMVTRVIPVKMETKDIKVILVILELMENKYVTICLLFHHLDIVIIIQGDVGSEGPAGVQGPPGPKVSDHYYY